MREKLLQVRTVLHTLLQDSKEWHGLQIDDEAPHVDRLWRQLPDGTRLSLHRIYQCAPGAALYHPHPWPSAMELVRGSYRMLVGFGDGPEPPPVALDETLVAGSVYAMNDARTWHSVTPLDDSAYTVMLTGAPWGTGGREPKRALATLSNHRKQSLLEVFRNHFPPPTYVDG